MTLASQTFEQHKPTEQQIQDMNSISADAREFAIQLDQTIPDGPDKTYLLRKFREVIMWAKVAIMKQADGSPRYEQQQGVDTQP